MSTKDEYEDIREKVIVNLKKIFDPEIPVNVYDLGLIYEINFEQKDEALYCVVYMTLTSPACPVAGTIMEQVRLVTQAVEEINEAKVHITFKPKWTNDMVSEEGKEIMLATGSVI